jgi:hypothetical protein
LLGGVAVVHGEGVDVDRAVAVGEQAEVEGLALDAQPEQALVDPVDQLEPAATLGIEALAQGGARRHLHQPQGAQRKGAGPQRLDGLEVALAHAQQPEVASKDVAVGDAAADGEGGIDQGVEVDALEVLPDQRQAGGGIEVVGQLLDDEVGHRGLTCGVKPILRLSYCSIKEKQLIVSARSRIQDQDRHQDAQQGRTNAVGDGRGREADHPEGRGAATRHGGVTVRFCRKPDGSIRAVEFQGCEAAINAEEGVNTRLDYPRPIGRRSRASHPLHCHSKRHAAPYRLGQRLLHDRARRIGLAASFQQHRLREAC